MYGQYIFNFLKESPFACHISCTYLYSHQYYMCSLFYISSPTLVFVLIIVTLTGMRWHLTVVLIYITPMISDVELLFMCPLAICMLSLEKYLFRFSVCFSIVFFFMLSFLCVLDINAYWVYCLQIFSSIQQVSFSIC